MPDPKSRPVSVIEAPVGKHSAKPHEVYRLIEKMYPGQQYLELFARGKRKGWSSYGNEVGRKKAR